jgi:hypothetical protein
MTRETKIGLLVGLAFIIVIGILLSDHLTQTNEPQQAQLAQVAGNVRTGVAVPGGPQATPAAAPSAGAVTPSTQAVSPQQTVPTKEELTPAKPPVEIVQIGGAPAPQPQHSPAKPQAETAGQATPEQPVADAEHTAPPAAHSTDRGAGSIASVAHTMGEDVISLEHPATPKADAPAQAQKPLLVASLPAGARQYKAEAGDSLSKMASKLLGGNTKGNRDAIVALNPSLQQNANMVIVGRTYAIPAGGSAMTAAVTGGATPAPAPAPQPAPAKPQAEPAAPTQVASATPQYFYTVKPGDSLTKIAVVQLGSADAVPAIMDLNKETLKGKDVIRPNMKLRLPAKPLASAE